MRLIIWALTILQGLCHYSTVNLGYAARSRPRHFHFLTLTPPDRRSTHPTRETSKRRHTHTLNIWASHFRTCAGFGRLFGKLHPLTMMTLSISGILAAHCRLRNSSFASCLPGVTRSLGNLCRTTIIRITYKSCSERVLSRPWHALGSLVVLTQHTKPLVPCSHP